MGLPPADDRGDRDAVLSRRALLLATALAGLVAGHGCRLARADVHPPADAGTDGSDADGGERPMPCLSIMRPGCGCLGQREVPAPRRQPG